MTEGVETCLAVAGAHAAFTKATEWQLVTNQMHDRIVDACAARADFV